MTESSVVELEIWEILKELQEFKEDVRVKDVERILDLGGKLVNKCEDLRLSRDKWRDKHEELRRLYGKQETQLNMLKKSLESNSTNGKKTT